MPFSFTVFIHNIIVSFFNIGLANVNRERKICTTKDCLKSGKYIYFQCIIVLSTLDYRLVIATKIFGIIIIYILIFSSNIIFRINEYICKSMYGFLSVCLWKFS